MQLGRGNRCGVDPTDRAIIFDHCHAGTVGRADFDNAGASGRCRSRRRAVRFAARKIYCEGMFRDRAIGIAISPLNAGVIEGALRRVAHIKAERVGIAVNKALCAIVIQAA